MQESAGGLHYVPGTYAHKRPDVSETVRNYFKRYEMEKAALKKKMEPREPDVGPTICFSRKIGVGALEIADILAPMIGFQVFDREILEYISRQNDLSQKAIHLFDERYPGRRNEIMAYLFGEKSFIQSDYSRQLFSTVYAIATQERAIFVGRGTHLILPRSRVLAVRFIAGAAHRVARLAKILGAEAGAVERKLAAIDKEQREYFKKVFSRHEASPYEFDLVVNCDHIASPAAAAEIVRQAFIAKFGSEACFTPAETAA